MDPWSHIVPPAAVSLGRCGTLTAQALQGVFQKQRLELSSGWEVLAVGGPLCLNYLLSLVLT